MIGKKVIVRTYSAGVHFGTLEKLDGKNVTLSNTRRIWYWEGAFTLSAIALDGLSKKSKLSVEIPELILTEAIEIIPVSEKAEKILTQIPAHE
jgi:ferredoxin-fold anticodon binding domain-containing protein